MSDWFLRGDYGAAPTDYATFAIGLLLAFVCGQSMAWMYQFTHTGLSYSRSFVRTLVLMPVLVAMVMMVLANNLVVAFGLMAIFAMVRFRSILRDTLDTALVLAVIVIGLACGTMKFTSVIIGCGATLAIMLYLWATSFGTRHRYDLILNVHWSRPAADMPALLGVLHRHSLSVVCASQRADELAGGLDVSYRVRLRDPDRSEELFSELKALAGVAQLTTLGAADESEL
jgi:hypothetical protein